MYIVYIMHRTQIYLDEHDYRELQAMSRRLGRSMAEIIRGAVRQMLAQRSDEAVRERLQSAFGLWQDRPVQETDARRLREEWSERTERHGTPD
jgi:Arc/MetJ-type ribon-helix-helix transcriptional regulator